MPGTTTAAGASTSRGIGIRSSKSNDEKDSSNHGNDGNSSTCKSGRGGKKLRLPRRTMRLRRAMATTAAMINVGGPGQCRWVRLPSVCILNPCKPFPAVSGQGQGQSTILLNYFHIKSVIFLGLFPYDTKSTSATNEIAIRTQC